MLMSTLGHSFLASRGSRKAANEDYCVHVSDVKSATVQTPHLFLQLAVDSIFISKSLIQTH